MTIDKTMFADEVRNYCIKNRMYTKGNNADYSAMLERADQCMSDADIIAVCRDIWEHSDNELYIEYGGTFSSFAFDFMADCVHLFIKEDEE